MIWELSALLEHWLSLSAIRFTQPIDPHDMVLESRRLASEQEKKMFVLR